MPTDNVINRNFEDLFSNPVRYEIPFFQRGYAWEQRRWKKLLEDLNNEVIEIVENNNFDNEENKVKKNESNINQEVNNVNQDENKLNQEANYQYYSKH